MVDHPEDGPSSEAPADAAPEELSAAHRYWRAHLKILAALLFVWALVSYGFSILLVDELDQIRLGGFKLGFWFSQQGSIFVFVAIIAVYVFLMNRLDERFGFSDRNKPERDAGGEP